MMPFRRYTLCKNSTKFQTLGLSEPYLTYLFIAEMKLSACIYWLIAYQSHLLGKHSAAAPTSIVEAKLGEFRQPCYKR